MTFSKTKAFLGIAILAAGLSGCLEQPLAQPTNLYVAAMHGFLAVGDKYNGSGVLQFGQGVLTAFDLDPETNTGNVVATGNRDGKIWRIECKEFAQQGPDRAFQEGGLVRNLLEHGDSGHGDESVPKFLAEAAAWGTGYVTVDGEPHPDEITPSETKWTCHLMVTKQGFRDDRTRAIYKDASRQAFYAREKGTGLVVEGDEEVHLQLKAAATQQDKIKNERNGTYRLRAEDLKSVVPGANPPGQKVPAFETPYRQTPFRFTIAITLAGEPPANVSQAPDQSRPSISYALFREGASQPVEGTEGELTEQRPSRTADVTVREPGKYEFRLSSKRSTPVQMQYDIDINAFASSPPQLVYNFWYETVTWGLDAQPYDAFHLKPQPKKPTGESGAEV